MSPIHCQRGLLQYNACLSCRYRDGDKCNLNMPITVNLADILTLDERLSILEDRKEVPPVNIVTITRQDYQNLQRLILSLQERLLAHIDKSKKTGKKYEFME